MDTGGACSRCGSDDGYWYERRRKTYTRSSGRRGYHSPRMWVCRPCRNHRKRRNRAADVERTRAKWRQYNIATRTKRRHGDQPPTPASRRVARRLRALAPGAVVLAASIFNTSYDRKLARRFCDEEPEFAYDVGHGPGSVTTITRISHEDDDRTCRGARGGDGPGS